MEAQPHWKGKVEANVRMTIAEQLMCAWESKSTN